jgi:hypothetical protein
LHCSGVRPRWWLVAVSLLCASHARAQQADSPTLYDYDAPDPDRDGVNYARAAANVLWVDWAIWQVAWARHKDWAPVDRESLERNLHSGFEFDVDTLRTNFFGHPFHGNLQFNAARGAGLSFWESFAYNAAGSVAWEFFSEREKPSYNDLVATTLAGTMLGEITYRLSSAILNDTKSGGTRLWRELAASAVNPMRGFNRLYTGQAWYDGPPPLRHPIRLEFDVGVDRVRAVHEDEGFEATEPAPLLAVDAVYGNLLPLRKRTTLGPFEFFDFYAALNLFNGEVSGEQVYSSGLLYGFSSDTSTDPGTLIDNNVFGFAMNYEYVGANFTTYSGVGIGPVDHLVVRLGGERGVRLSVGLDIVPILGASSPVITYEDRDYNFATGLAPWASLKLRMGRAGELGLRTRHYVTSVIDGAAGEEFVGSMRLWYEVDLFDKTGLGVAPTLIYRRGFYQEREDYKAQQLSTQFYLSFHQ